MAENDQSQVAEGATEETGGFADAFAERAKDPSVKAPEADAPASADQGGQSANADQPGAAPTGAADEGSGPKPEGFDPYAGLTPEQKSYFEAESAEKIKLAASERSQRGRVGALTKKLNGLTRTQSPPPEGQSGQARSDVGADGSTGSTGAPQASDIEARLKAATDEYGDIVGPVAEIVQDLRKQVETLTASATRNEVDQDAKALEEAYGALEKAHPDYQTVAADPKFHEWLGNQTSGVQALANSFDPSEVSLTLQLFKTESGAASQAPREGGEGGSGGTATGDKRERQLNGMRQPPTRGAPAAAGVPDDFKSAFRARSEAKAR